MADTRKFGNARPGQPAAKRGKTLTGEVQPADPAEPAARLDPTKTILDIPIEIPHHDSRQTLQMAAPAVAAELGLPALGNLPAEPAAPARGRDSQPPVAAPAVTLAPPSAAHAAAHPPTIELVKHQLPEDSPLDRRLVLLRDPDSARAAAFRVLRHHLLERGRPRVIAVTSASDRDGKTTAATNLALALAECGRARVLLVDANLKRPQLAGIFRFIPPWCFLEQLKAHREQPLSPWGFVELTGPALHVAAINPRTEHRSALDGQAFAFAIERLRLADYDHIVVDCASVVGTADVNLVEDAADAVVVVGRARKTTARELRLVIEQLTDTKIAGIALLE